mmetsp:Transcript_12130/g.22234  ORF Transcript_12130/g.22234 Transcript_12130/m.22234 type:complete len:207 (-) Transcript_12130:1419-2039(-)
MQNKAPSQINADCTKALLCQIKPAHPTPGTRPVPARHASSPRPGHVQCAAPRTITSFPKYLYLSCLKTWSKSPRNSKAVPLSRPTHSFRQCKRCLFEGAGEHNPRRLLLKQVDLLLQLRGSRETARRGAAKTPMSELNRHLDSGGADIHGCPARSPSVPMHQKTFAPEPRENAAINVDYMANHHPRNSSCHPEGVRMVYENKAKNI